MCIRDRYTDTDNGTLCYAQRYTEREIHAEIHGKSYLLNTTDAADDTTSYRTRYPQSGEHRKKTRQRKTRTDDKDSKIR